MKSNVSSNPQSIGSSVELQRILFQPAPLSKINLSESMQFESKRKVKKAVIDALQSAPVSPRPVSKRKEFSQSGEEELMPIQNEAVRTLFFAQQQVPQRNVMVNLQSQI